MLVKAPSGWMWAGPQCSTLVLGPPRSGKTSSLVIPNILLSDGPVVSTSTKPDVMRATAPARCSEGWSFLYDPSGEVECPPGVERVGWSPLTTASDWDAAVVTADAMVGASRLSGQRGRRAALDRACRRAALHAPPCRRHGGPLHARRPADGSIATMGRRPSKFSPRAPEGTLRLPICSPGSSPPIPVSSQVSGPPHRASWPRTARREHSHPPAPRHSTSRRSAAAPTPSTSAQPGGGSANSRRSWWPSSGDVRDAAYVRSRDGHTGPPTLLALDEVANIAPIPDLPAMVSEGAGQGLLVLACLQDLSQARVRWGAAADGFLSLFGTTVVLRGIADTATLRDISALAGDREVAATTVSRSVDRWGRHPPLDVGREHPAGPPPGGCGGTRLGRSRPRPRAGQGGARGGAHACARACHPGVSSCRRPASSPPPGPRRPGPLSQRPRPTLRP